MNRVLKLSLSVVVGASFSASLFAQSSFVDVNDSQWAADAVARLKIGGFIQGYEDGKFRGNKDVSRYEMASLVYAIYAKLVCFNEEIEKKAKELEAKINNVRIPESQPPKPVDYSPVKKSINDLKIDLGGYKAWSSDLKMLRTMSERYGKELKSLGVDVKDFQKQVDSLTERISSLEKKSNPIQIAGDANFLMLVSNCPPNPVLNQDGRWINPTGHGAGLDHLQAYHEVGVEIKNAADAEIPVRAEVILGSLATNGLDGWGSQSDYNRNLGQPITDNSFAGYLNRLEVKIPKYNASIGRQGIDLGSYIFQRIDQNSFYVNERDDNGQWAIDGVRVGFGGNVKGEFFMGRVANLLTTSGNVQGLDFGFGNIERATGVTLKPFGENVQATYVQFDNNGAVGANRQEVWGIDANVLKKDNVQLDAGYGQSRTKDGTVVIGATNRDNSRFNVDLAFGSAKTRLGLNYRRVEQNYNAPGNWGRVGVFRNFTDVSALGGLISHSFGEKAGVFGGYELGNAIAGNGDYRNLTLGGNYQILKKWNLGFTHDNSKFNSGFAGINNGARIEFNTFNLDYEVTKGRFLRVFFQSVGNDNLNVGGAIPGSFTGHGQWLGLQFSQRF